MPVLDPEVLIGGLTNQLYGLVGLVLLANLTGSQLVLPQMLSHVTGGGVHARMNGPPPCRTLTLSPSGAPRRQVKCH